MRIATMRRAGCMRQLGSVAGYGWLTTALLAAGACTSTDKAMPLEPLSSTQVATGRAQATFRFDSIVPPGATTANAQGINALGHIAGFFSTADGRLHGFLLANGTFTVIDHDATSNTDARGIGPDDEIVGTWAAPSEPAVAFHGYKRTAQGQFLSVHYPGHLYEVPQRVLRDGTILGCRHDNDLMTTMRGIVIGPKDTAEVTTFASMNNGATPDRGRSIGTWVDTAGGNRSEGYIIDHGVSTTLLFPGTTQTSPWDVNARGEVVGVFRDAAGLHGFVLTSAGYTPIDFPGATATRVFGVNDRGDVVGAYVAGGKTHAFVGIRTN